MVLTCAWSRTTSTPWSSTSSSCRGSPSRPTAGASGGGHYDRFLPRLRDDCVTVGAAFVEQLVGDLPTESHDVQLTHVATDA